jgi:hypothetical protein
MRICAIGLGLSIALTIGCENKSGSTSSGAATITSGGGADTYAKKLVGVWEGKLDFGGKDAPMTVEFKADGSMKISMGGEFESKGTYKVVKEEAKVVTVDTETSNPFADPKGAPKMDKKTMTATFEDANTIVLQHVGDKPDPLKLKRKS